MTENFTKQTVLIVGASGGLGRVYAQAFLDAGATVLIAGRDAEKMATLAQELPITAHYVVDLQSETSITQLANRIAEHYPNLGVVVNATGYDVRKAYQEHTFSDVAQSLDINLRGAIWLTYAFIKSMPSGVIVHMGGFADGYLALPYYSANVASRAGLRGFVDAMNRELVGQAVRVMFFCPSPADTPAERPFHALWQQMGTPIVKPEVVAQSLLRAIQGKQTVVVMGGFLTRFFAKLNAAFPTLANGLLLNNYGKKMKQFFAPDGEIAKKNAPKAYYLGIALMVWSFIGYGIALGIVPLLPLSTETKVVAVPFVLVTSEASFWIGGAIVGKEAVTQFKKCFDFRALLGWQK